MVVIVAAARRLGGDAKPIRVFSKQLLRVLQGQYRGRVDVVCDRYRDQHVIRTAHDAVRARAFYHPYRVHMRLHRFLPSHVPLSYRSSSLQHIGRWKPISSESSKKTENRVYCGRTNFIFGSRAERSEHQSVLLVPGSSTYVRVCRLSVPRGV